MQIMIVTPSLRRYLGVLLMVAALAACSSKHSAVNQNESVAAPATSQSSDASPVYVSSIGFPPNKACLFLANNPAFPDPSTYSAFPGSQADYSCGTRYYEIEAGSNFAGLDNNISYYVRGTPTSAKRVRVLLNVNDRDNVVPAYRLFQKTSADLYRAALGKDMPKEISLALANADTGQWAVGSYRVEFERKTWPTGKGFEFNFVIRDPGYEAPY